MTVKFCPIASGSNGNSIYISGGGANILIDAGLSGKRIEEGLSRLDNKACDIDAIFVTHEHSDHIQGVGILSRRHDIPVYATPKTWRYIDRHQVLGKIKEENKISIEPDEKCYIKDLCVQAFDIPHDSSQPVGYSVYAGRYKITVATDIGHVTDAVREGVCDSDILLLESNHDIEMLVNGRYPKMLKDRVMGQKGHLSNAEAGRLLTEVVTGRLKHVYLGHLSEENNRPLIALDTVRTILTANKINSDKAFTLRVACRGAMSEAVEL